MFSSPRRDWSGGGWLVQSTELAGTLRARSAVIGTVYSSVRVGRLKQKDLINRILHLDLDETPYKPADTLKNLSLTFGSCKRAKSEDLCSSEKVTMKLKVVSGEKEGG